MLLLEEEEDRVMKREIQISGTWRECEWLRNRKVPKEKADKYLKSMLKDFLRKDLKTETQEVCYG